MDRPALQLLRDRPRSRVTGIAVATLAIALTTLVIFPLREGAPAVSTGVVYLLAVLLVSTLWGLWLGLGTAVAGALAWNFFHIPPTGHFRIADAEHLVALGVFLATAVVASTLADLARARAAEAERRRQEADLAAELARVLLGEGSVEEALPVASTRLAPRSGCRTPRSCSIRRRRRTAGGPGSSTWDTGAARRCTSRAALPSAHGGAAARARRAGAGGDPGRRRWIAIASRPRSSRRMRCGARTSSRPRSCGRCRTTCARR